jgi:hypothetical protein
MDAKIGATMPVMTCNQTMLPDTTSKLERTSKKFTYSEGIMTTKTEVICTASAKVAARPCLKKTPLTLLASGE